MAFNMTYMQSNTHKNYQELEKGIWIINRRLGPEILPSGGGTRFNTPDSFTGCTSG